VPNANWNDGKFNVNADWYNAGNRNDNLRARSEVSNRGANTAPLDIQMDSKILKISERES
jgi:hypothetical protein